MNRGLFAFALFPMTLTTEMARAQTAGPTPFLDEWRASHPSVSGAAGPSEPTVGVSYDVVVTTATIPVVFNKLEKEPDGKYRIGPVLGLGFGYTLIIGKAKYELDKKITIEPELLFGAALDGGVRSGSEQVEASYGGSAFLGFGRFAAAVGYDIQSKTVFFGLNTRIDAFSLLKNQYTVWRIKEN